MKKQSILLFFVITICACNKLHRSLEKKLSELREESVLLYGNETTFKDNALELKDLEYPRTDKRKLIHISQQWLDHYECTLRLTRQLIGRRLPSTATSVFEGTCVKLSCGLCLSPRDKGMVTWLYAEPPDNLTFTPLPEGDTIVRERDGNITLYHTGYESGGVYRCRVGDSYGGLRVLEVVAAENYSVVKPLSTRGPYPTPPQSVDSTLGGLTLFTSWSGWSECSRCDRVGRRRRYGMCAVLLASTYKSQHKSRWDNSETTSVADLFQEFPDGIPCRSRYLPDSIRGISQVQGRQNEVMIGLCKVPCKRFALKARSHANQVKGVEITGQFSPVAVNDVILARPGDRAIVRCPGTTLRDLPVTWRVGSKEVVPRDLDKGSGGRLYINAMDHVVITSVQTDDASLYRCWQAGTLAGTVKLVVWRD